MTAAWLFLAVSVYGALFTINAYRPFRVPVAVIPVFFASWLTTELAAHHILWQAAATAVFIGFGALQHVVGWIGLAVTLASWAGLAGLVKQGGRAGHEIEDALIEGLGERYRDEIDSELVARHDPRPSRLRLVLAFHSRRREVERIRNLSYGPAGRRNMLDVWRHVDAPSNAPVLLWIHGGGWVIGHKAQQALPMINHLAARGWVCVSANYRLSPRATFPDHLIDVKKALAWVRAHVTEYGGNREFVMISGGSAGGHLASLAALTANDPEYQPGFEDADTAVQACVPFYGVYDFTNRFESRSAFEGYGYRRFLERQVMKVSMADDPEAWRKASPIDRVQADAPPFFVIHGTHDVLAPARDADEFVTRLRDVSREPVAYAKLHRTQHAFEVFHSVRTGHVIHGVERFGDWVWTRELRRRATSSADGLPEGVRSGGTHERDRR